MEENLLLITYLKRDTDGKLTLLVRPKWEGTYINSILIYNAPKKSVYIGEVKLSSTFIDNKLPSVTLETDDGRIQKKYTFYKVKLKYESIEGKFLDVDHGDIDHGFLNEMTPGHRHGPIIDPD